MTTISIIILVWLAGVIVAWFQIKRWNKGYVFDTPKALIELGILSLLSWLVYPLFYIDKYNQENDE